MFADRLLREARVQAAGGVIDLSPSIAGLTVASSVTASDSFPFITASGNGYRGTASLIRDYALGISGGTATIPENVVIQGNTTLGDAATDTITTTGRWVSDAVPLADNVRSLGAVALRWANLYATTVTATTLDVSGDTTLGGDVTFAGPWQHPDVIAGTFTIAANYNGALLGPVGVSGTIDVAGTLAILA